MRSRKELTRSISCARNIQCVVDNSARQVACGQGVESPVVQLGNVANHNGSGEETDVLESVLLRSFGADDCCLRGCEQVSKAERAEMSNVKRVMLPTLVNALVAIDLTRVSARVFVVKLAQTGGVEMGSDTKHPRGGDGVQRLFVLTYCPVHCRLPLRQMVIRTKLRVWSRSAAAMVVFVWWCMGMVQENNSIHKRIGRSEASTYGTYKAAMSVTNMARRI